MTERRDIEPEEESKLERKSKEKASREATEAALRRSNRPHLMLREHIRPHEMFALAGGFGLLALLLVTLINPIIHPVFPLGALLFFLYPFRREIVARRTMQLGILTFVIWLFLILSSTLFPFIFAFIIAYLFSPLVTRLAERGIPRWATALGIVLLILGVYVLIGFLVIPSMIEQFSQLAQSARGFLKDANTVLNRDFIIRRLTRYGLPPQQAKEIVTNYLEPQITNILSGLFGWLASFLRNVSAILEGIFTLILIPMLAFYMMIDFPRIRSFVRSTVLQDKPIYVYYIKRVDTIVSAYLRGILLTSSMVAALAVGILSAFDVPYAVVIGILTGVFNLIPTVGMFLNLGVAMIIYLFAPGSFWLHTLITAVMIAGLHAFNSYLVEPRIIGDRVGLHPVMVIASLFIFAHFLGFIGLLIAVPTMAVCMMFLKEWYRRTISMQQPVYVTPDSVTQ